MDRFNCGTRKLKKSISTWLIVKRVRGFDNLFSLTRFFPRVKNKFLCKLPSIIERNTLQLVSGNGRFYCNLDILLRVLRIVDYAWFVLN